MTITANDYIKSAKLRVEEETLFDGSTVFNLWVGAVGFPCFSQKHAQEAMLAVAVALANATFDSTPL